MTRHDLVLLPAALSLAVLATLAGPVEAAGGQALVTVTPCRVLDTRNPPGPLGGPALAPGEVRLLPVAGTCGVPANALGVVVNLTAVSPAASGFARLYAGDEAVPPLAQVLSFTAGRSRASIALVALAANGSGTAALMNVSWAAVDFVLDVSGYFVPACTGTIVVANPATSGGTVNAAFSQTFTATGGTGALTFATASPLPSGLTLSAAGVLSGTPTQPGTFPITVTATDANGCTGTGSTYTLVVACQTIGVTNPATATGAANAPFSQTFTSAGGVGAVTFSTASPLPAGLTLDSGGTLHGTPTQAGGFDIVVTARDANGCTGSGATYHLVINCQAIAVTNPAVTAGTATVPFSQTFTQSGAIGTATFSTSSTLPAGLTLAANGVLSGTPTQTGSFPIVVKVTDGNLCTGAGATYALSIACQTIAVTNPSTATATAGAPFSQTFTATNIVGAATFSTASTLPTGLSLASDGTLSGTPTQTGTFPITVVVTDANGCTGLSATYTLVVSCQTFSVLPAALPEGTSGTAYSVSFTAPAGIGPVTFAQAGTLPNGIGFSVDTLSGTPTETGSFPITVTATDFNGCTASRDTLLVVSCTGASITLSPGALAAAPANAPFPSTQFTASGGTGPYTFQQAGVLPDGMQFVVDTLSGTPTKTGAFPITISATDASGCAGSQDYVITITCNGVTITVAPPSLSSGPVGSPYGPVTFTPSGGSAPYALAETGALPPGMTYAAGILSGTPTQPGAFPVTVTATDANGCTGQTVYSLVTTCPTITVTNPATTTGTAGTPFSQPFSQTGGSGTTTFSTTSTLPTGLTLNSDGTLHGTTTQTGTFPIVVVATDANGCNGTGATYTLVIACQSIGVTNPGTAAGTEGSSFDQAFTATGTLGTVTWSTASPLPAGLTLNSSTGHLSGTPTQTGTFPIVAVATDTNGCTGTGATYALVLTCPTINVTGAIPALTMNTPMATATFSQTGTGSSVTWSASGLPPGLSIGPSNGQVTGTPTATGSYSVTVTATDAGGCSGSKSLTVNVAPRAFNDTYPETVVGNVSVNSALIAYSVLTNDAYSAGASITAFDATSANGGTVSMTTSGAGAGQFTYNPPAGFAGTDTFTYTLTSAGGSSTATVSMSVAGMIWFVNNAGPSGDGRLSSPFNTLAAFQAANDGVGNHPKTGQSVFLYQSATAYSGPVTLLAGQKLVGQDSTSSLSAITGLTPGASSAAFPAMSPADGTATKITSSGTTVTLGTGNTVNGLTLGDATTSALKGTSFGTLTVADVIVNTNGTVKTIDLNTGVLAATFVSISASGGVNGIVLQSTTGSFAVAGTGGNCAPLGPTCSGGTITGMTGIDDSSATPVGTAIVLNNAQNVSLTRMRINGNTNYGVRGTSVAGFAMDTCLLDGVNGTNGSTPYNDGALSFDNLTGSASVSNTNIQGGLYDNVRVVNTSGTLDRLTFTNVTFDVSGVSPANDALTIESQNGAVVKVTVQTSVFKSAAGDLFNLTNNGTGADDLVFTNNTLTNANPAIATGGGGVTVATNGTGDLTYDIETNTFRDAVGAAVLLVKSTGAATMSGTFHANTIGVSGVANSGSLAGDGLKVQTAGQGTMKAAITNNQIFQYNNFGIDLLAGGGAAAQSGAFAVAVTGNTIAQPGTSSATQGIAKNGIQLNGGTVPGDTYQICADISGNTMAGSGADSVPPSGLGAIDFRLRQRQSTTARLPGYGGANNDNTAVVNFVIGNNVGSPTGSATNTVPTGGGFVGGAACLP